MNEICKLIEKSHLIGDETKLLALIALDYIMRFSSEEYKQEISLCKKFRNKNLMVSEIFIWSKHDYDNDFWLEIHQNIHCNLRREF